MMETGDSGTHNNQRNGHMHELRCSQGRGNFGCNAQATGQMCPWPWVTRDATAHAILAPALICSLPGLLLRLHRHSLVLHSPEFGRRAAEERLWRAEDSFPAAKSLEMATDLRGWWRQKREDLALQQRESTKPSFMIPSPVEDKDIKLSLAEEKAARAKHCTDEGMKAGLKAGLWACAFTAIPTLAAVRFVPWAKANINYTGQALIISAATISTYFVVTEQTILECSRKGNAVAIEKSRAGVTA